MYTFGELLKGFRQREGLTQGELAADLGVHRNSIGVWERSSYLPGTREMVLGLAEALTLSLAETDQLLRAAQYPLETQGQIGSEATPTKALPGRQQDWGEAPDVSIFYGRQAEAAQLKQWLVADGCRLVAVLGMGGIGKTVLVTWLAEQFKDEMAPSDSGMSPTQES